MADEGKSPEGAGDGSLRGSEPKYTEEQWRGLQSSLTKKYDEARKAAVEATERARALEDRMEELEIARKSAAEGKPETDTRLSDLRRERELKRREEAIAAATLDIERKRLAVEHNLTPETIEGNTVAELKASALEQVLARERSAKPPKTPEPLDRGNGGAPNAVLSDLETAALIVARARKPRS